MMMIIETAQKCTFYEGSYVISFIGGVVSLVF